MATIPVKAAVRRKFAKGGIVSGSLSINGENISIVPGSLKINGNHIPEADIFARDSDEYKIKVLGEFVE